jgi:hypothetical protein
MKNSNSSTHVLLLEELRVASFLFLLVSSFSHVVARHSRFRSESVRQRPGRDLRSLQLDRGRQLGVDGLIASTSPICKKREQKKSVPVLNLSLLKVVRGALNASKPSPALEASIEEAIKQMYFVSCFIVFGDKSREVCEWLVSKGSLFRRQVNVYTLRETGEEILRNYSFLATSSDFEIETVDFELRAVPHQINDFVYLGDYSAGVCTIFSFLILVSSSASSQRRARLSRRWE